MPEEHEHRVPLGRMLAYGASFDLTPKEKGMKGSIARAQERPPATPGVLWIPSRLENPWPP